MDASGQYLTSLAIFLLISMSLATNCNEEIGITLTNDYSPKIAPFVNVGEPVKVTSVFFVPEIAEINDKARTFSFVVINTKSWTDQRINITGDNSVSISASFVDKCMWKPQLNLFFTEEIRMEEWFGMPQSIKILENGKVIYTTISKVTLGCVMDFDWYPFDTQVG